MRRTPHVVVENRTAAQVSAMAALLVLAGCSGAVRSLPPPGAAQGGAASFDAWPMVSYKSIFSFDGTDGTTPIAGLISVKNTMYGTASNYLGGNCCGVVFKISTDGTEKTLYAFQGGSDGTEPWSRLLDVNGTLYGTTMGGGTHSSGVVFKISTNGKEKVIHTFGNGADGRSPFGPLINVGGTLYGMTAGGGSTSSGTVFKITTSGSEKVIYSFKGYPKDGSGPGAGLKYLKGALYGTTGGGGTANDGTIFKVTTSGSEKVLHAFTGKDGFSPSSTLLDVNGTLYGTTRSGGANNNGTVFKIGASGSGFKVLHSFKGKPDGATPGYTELTDVGGTLYGVTANGGTSNDGIVYKITTTGKESVLYSFKGGNDGRNPDAGLLELKGVLYGTTSQGGGSSDDGTVYSIKP